MPPTDGKATVAGYDVFDHPMEVKKRIGYLPETPPVYPEMEVGDYLAFVGRLKGIANVDLKRRVDEVSERCAVADVKKKLIAKLSKGYRQRVGLAQAIIHNPDVLILDEPTSGLDPKQILETRELIKSLSGEHTIILSTHILPEVEAMCEKVIIINKGKIVATDSVENLTHRMRGTDTVAVEVETDGTAGRSDIQQQLERVSGVSKVLFKHAADHRMTFEVEGLAGQAPRADVARAVVNAGWNLLEMRSMNYSLEEVFLQLTGATTAATTPVVAGEQQ